MEKPVAGTFQQFTSLEAIFAVRAKEHAIS